MTILEEWKEKMIEDKTFHTFYRVQGGLSYEKFSLNEKAVVYNSKEKYTYFSESREHHQYYKTKRIDQLVLRNDNPMQKRDYLATNSLYVYRYQLPRIKENFKSMEANRVNIKCFSFYFLEDAFQLIKENSVYYMKRIVDNIPRRVDIKVNGGGYGLNDEWLRLFYLSTFMTEIISIEKEDIEIYLSKLSYLLSSEIEIGNEQKRRMIISSHLSSPFTKYELMDTLENIVEKGLTTPNSTLQKRPRQVIKTFVKSYENKREEAKRWLDNRMNKKYK